jgi:hypothetical protein
LRPDRRAIVKQQAFAQTHRPALAIIVDDVALDHLWLRLIVDVPGVEGLIDHHREIPAHGRRRPDRVEAGQIGLRHEHQRRDSGRDRGTGQGTGGSSRKKGPALHSFPPKAVFDRTVVYVFHQGACGGLSSVFSLEWRQPVSAKWSRYSFGEYETGFRQRLTKGRRYSCGGLSGQRSPQRNVS